MLDLHCHLLPGIDDGPQSVEKSVGLARKAVLNGITHVVLTPHIQPGTYNNTVKSIASAGLAFRVALRFFSIPLKVALAAEVRICPELIKMVQHKDFYKICIGEMDDGLALLLEFPHSHIPPGSELLIESLIKSKVKPVIAHPERNKALHIDPNRLESFVSMGCLVQLTASSVSGRFGRNAQKCASYFLKRGWVNVLASDAHNLNSRPPELMEGVKAAANLIGENAAYALVNENAFAILGKKRFEN